MKAPRPKSGLSQVGWFGLGVTGTGWSMLVSADLGKPLLDKVKELSGALVCCIKDGFGFGLLIS